jgi:hypothetical protein
MSQDLTVREEDKQQNAETSANITMETKPKPAVNEEEDELTQNPDGKFDSQISVFMTTSGGNNL